MDDTANRRFLAFANTEGRAVHVDPRSMVGVEDLGQGRCNVYLERHGFTLAMSAAEFLAGIEQKSRRFMEEGVASMRACAAEAAP